MGSACQARRTNTPATPPCLARPHKTKPRCTSNGVRLSRRSRAARLPTHEVHSSEKVLPQDGAGAYARDVQQPGIRYGVKTQAASFDRRDSSRSSRSSFSSLGMSLSAPLTVGTPTGLAMVWVGQRAASARGGRLGTEFTVMTSVNIPDNGTCRAMPPDRKARPRERTACLVRSLLRHPRWQARG